MQRALLLAKNGEGRVSPNPMVGAVIVYNDRIIGEGFHAIYGGPHAEVNAINSVKEADKQFLKDSKIYVTLEPCSHFGKTPPCANLIVDTGIPEVVVGCLDPNPKVAGRGIKILENAGVKVTTGVLEESCRNINKKFMKAHTSNLPYILLKWAQSSDGFMASIDEGGNLKPVVFSNPLSSVWMHRKRAGVDAIMVGANTERIDNPRLTVRNWGGNSPRKIVARNKKEDLLPLLENLRREGITSLMVEGGAALLNSFLQDGLYDEIRIETSPHNLEKGLKAPTIPNELKLVDTKLIRENLIQVFRR